jgi:hypothetical protein
MAKQELPLSGKIPSPRYLPEGAEWPDFKTEFG